MKAGLISKVSTDVQWLYITNYPKRNLSPIRSYRSVIWLSSISSPFRSAAGGTYSSKFFQEQYQGNQIGQQGNDLLVELWHAPIPHHTIPHICSQGKIKPSRAPGWTLWNPKITAPSWTSINSSFPSIQFDFFSPTWIYMYICYIQRKLRPIFQNVHGRGGKELPTYYGSPLHKYARSPLSHG